MGSSPLAINETQQVDPTHSISEKQKELKVLLRENNVVLVAVLEHRVNDNKAGQIIKRIATGWEW